MNRHLNGRILKLALPNILSNLTIPLLGMVDIALSGHLEDMYAIGAIAISTTIFSLLYWNFSFLRMGTTGLTAQSHGKADKTSMGRNLVQSLVIGVLGSIILLLFRSSLLTLALALLSPETYVADYARVYYNIVIWGAPAMLCTYALNGWLIGMQNTWWPMVVSILTNISNITLSTILVVYRGKGIQGIAIGTLAAQYIGVVFLVFGVYYIFIRKQTIKFPYTFRDISIGIGHYFGTNIYIFLRTILLALISLFFTFSGTQQGALTLAANALLYQFFNFFSYFIDGFAFAAEALVGHFFGMKDRASLQLSIKQFLKWGGVIACTMSVAYVIIASLFLEVLTDKPEVLSYARNYLGWIYILPFASFVAFFYDGIFIGATAVKEMFLSMLLAVLVFFALYYLLPFSDKNHVLWGAFVAYLGIRGIAQLILARKIRGIGHPFSSKFYLSIGTTLLDSQESIRHLLNREFPLGIMSSFYKSLDASGKSDKVYLNSVVSVESTYTLDEFIQKTKAVEVMAGRDKKSAEVALDIDVVMQDERVLREKDFRHNYFQKGYKELIET